MPEVAPPAQSMGRAMDTTDIKELLYRNQEHPRWDNVSERCLGCTNCTLVCPNRLWALHHLVSGGHRHHRGGGRPPCHRWCPVWRMRGDDP